MAKGSFTVFKTGQTNVTTAGTPVQVEAVDVGEGIDLVIKAKKANTGGIAIGYSSASALYSGTDSFKLEPNESIRLRIHRGDLIWVDAEISGEGIEWITEI